MANVTSEQARKLAELSHRRRTAQADRLRSLRNLDGLTSADFAARLLIACDETTAQIRLWRLLGAVHGYGPHRVGRLMHRAGIREARLDRKIGELTDRERRVIAATLRVSFRRPA